MIPSRQQAAQGPYGPLLTAGLYPTGQASGAPVAASTAAPVASAPGAMPAASPAPAAAPASSPLSVGSMSMDGDSGGVSAPSTPSPDQSFGGLMGALGTAASIGFGGPMGFAGALGSLAMSDALGMAPSFNMTGTALGDMFGGVTAEGSAPGPDGGSKDATAGTGNFGPNGPGADGTDPDGGMASEGGTGPDGGSKDSTADTGNTGPDGAAGEGGTGPDGGGKKEGGYTGAGHDGVVQPDNKSGHYTHEGEHVTKADATAYYGLDLLSMINNREIPRNRLRQIAGLD